MRGGSKSSFDSSLWCSSQSFNSVFKHFIIVVVIFFYYTYGWCCFFLLYYSFFLPLLHHIRRIIKCSIKNEEECFFFSVTYIAIIFFSHDFNSLISMNILTHAGLIITSIIQELPNVYNIEDKNLTSIPCFPFYNFLPLRIKISIYTIRKYVRTINTFLNDAYCAPFYYIIWKSSLDFLFNVNGCFIVFVNKLF